MKTNLHTHTNFSDGSAEPEVYVKKAIELGFTALGFSDHSPLPFDNTFAIQDAESLKSYVKTIRDLQEKYKDQIDILLGMEIDYISGVSGEFENLREKCGLDYVIGSVHLVNNIENQRLWFIDGPKIETYDDGLKYLFKGDIKKAVTLFYRQSCEMIEKHKPDIIGHIDKIKMHNHNRYFREDEKWYIDLVGETLELIKENNLIIEVNTRGLYKKRCDSLFPGIETLKRIRDLNIPVCINSDAHKPEELDGLMEYAWSVLEEVGIRIERFDDGLIAK